MSWSAFFPHNVAAHPSRFVGPNVAGAIVQGIETGILIGQSVRFWSRASYEPVTIRALVAFVSVAAAFQTAIAFYNTWTVVVMGFGNWMGVINLRWPDRIQPALNCLMAAPFQAYLIWRCWNALRRNLLVLALLVALLVASVVANIIITVQVFDFTPANVNDLVSGPPRAFITAFVITAVLDICITSLMLWFLIHAKSQAVSRRFVKVLGRLHAILWEAALPPCACAIAACAVYISMSLENLWDVFCQSILGKLYVISLFVILNGRADLKSVDRVRESPGLTKFWVSGAEVRVDLSSVIDVTKPASPEETEMTPTPALFDTEPSTPTTLREGKEYTR